ncbi:hypothetical protein NEHOM01_1249 [Nematocida homosporus]|uniref:uncharacterized protein n=1 Tax=Nematocida homosporus TaxID=1912981 RepID=UPI002220F3D5|nr:uncharacterized protein NEHOM01_1249 [Nematocida homosporus]KAI5186046.1 hypothetical protein NEHOM01_1249 [Nematocida homosporus]
MRCVFVLWLCLVTYLATISEQFESIPKYTKSDLVSPDPILLFIYYDGQDKGKCMACEGYKQWLTQLRHQIGVFKIKRLNFYTSPTLVLRFKTTNFPTFFLQYQQEFKNITDVDFFNLGLRYHNNRYANDIDAILKNPQVLDRITTLKGLKAPSSICSLIYAQVLAVLLSTAHCLDILHALIPYWVLFLTILVLLLAARLCKRSPTTTADQKNK